MSILNFTLKQEHLALLRALNWSLHLNKFVVSCEDFTVDESPFGGNNIYEDMDLILNGKPDDFETLIHGDGEYNIPQEQKEEFDKLLSELPLALEVILRAQTFELGDYKAKFHQRFSWKKLPKQ
jgi:hypothetical protein